MSQYVVAFRGQPDRPPAGGEDGAWNAWFGSLGSAVIDPGHRVGRVRTVAGQGQGAGPAASAVLTGYVVIDAPDWDAATQAALNEIGHEGWGLVMAQ